LEGLACIAEIEEEDEKLAHFCTTKPGKEGKEVPQISREEGIRLNTFAYLVK